MQGIFVFLGILLALLALLLLLPVKAYLTAAITPLGGRGRVRIRILCFHVNLVLRLHLLEQPCLCLERICANGVGRRLWKAGRRRQSRDPWGEAVLQALKFSHSKACWQVGIAGEPAASALVCGLLSAVSESAAAVFAPHIGLKVRAEPVYGQTLLRLNLESIAKARLAEIILKRMKE